MESLLEELLARRQDRQRQGLVRELDATAEGIDFCSNDYLGFAADAATARALWKRWEGWKGTPHAAPASRLLRGTTTAHLQLELRLARFKGASAALLFATGYQANLGLLTALLGPEDRAISDALNHASLIDGLRLSGCRKVIVPHLDLEAIEAALAAPHPTGRTFLVTESLFSMDGDTAPLERYAELVERHDALLIVDDAHATGLYGARGSGLVEASGVEERTLAVTSTFGKALGLCGGMVSGPRAVIDHLIDHARSFVFTTAPPPLLLAGVDLALDRVAAEPELRHRVGELSEQLRRALVDHGLARPGGRGPIVPVLLGDTERALQVAAAVSRRGFDVRAVRPPTVAPGTARLRVSVHASHSKARIDQLAGAIGDAMKEAGLLAGPPAAPIGEACRAAGGAP